MVLTVLSLSGSIMTNLNKFKESNPSNICKHPYLTSAKAIGVVPSGEVKTDVCRENTDVRWVGFHPLTNLNEFNETYVARVVDEPGRVALHGGVDNGVVIHLVSKLKKNTFFFPDNKLTCLFSHKNVQSSLIFVSEVIN
jgi:hypothetical protein